MYGLFTSEDVVIDNGDFKDDHLADDANSHITNMMFIQSGKFIENNPEDSNSMKCPKKVALKRFCIL